MGENTPPSISSLSVFRGAVVAATRELWPTFKSRAPLFVGLHILAFLAGQYFRYSEEISAQRMSESLGLVATNAGLAISFELFWHAAFFLLTVQALADRTRNIHTPPTNALFRHFNALVIENTRVIARVIFWLPFLLLPAAYQYLKLFFVGFVVVDDAGYELGRVSALERSRELTQGRIGLCICSILLATLAEPLITGLVHGGEIAVWRNPVGALISLPVSMVLNVWALIFLFHVFRDLSHATGFGKSLARLPEERQSGPAPAVSTQV